MNTHSWKLCIRQGGKIGGPLKAPGASYGPPLKLAVSRFGNGFPEALAPSGLSEAGCAAHKNVSHLDHGLRSAEGRCQLWIQPSDSAVPWSVRLPIQEPVSMMASLTVSRNWKLITVPKAPIMPPLFNSQRQPLTSSTAAQMPTAISAQIASCFQKKTTARATTKAKTTDPGLHWAFSLQTFLQSLILPYVTIAT